jgi:glycosyltransferase involved in cell wall biosynthesis
MHVVYPGIAVEDWSPPDSPPAPPAIGYVSRQCETLGLGVLVDAFIRLKQDERLREVKLRVTGGQRSDDRQFDRGVRRRLEAQSLLRDVEFLPEFDRAHRIDFMRSLSVLSVPAPRGEAFGLYQLEALASGVPLVQPRVGAYPEIAEATGGSLLVKPDDPVALAVGLKELLLDPARAREMGLRGRQAVAEQFSDECAARAMLGVFEAVM